MIHLIIGNAARRIGFGNSLVDSMNSGSLMWMLKRDALLRQLEASRRPIAKITCLGLEVC
jgi:hypothetical protein